MNDTTTSETETAPGSAHYDRTAAYEQHIRPLALQLVAAAREHRCPIIVLCVHEQDETGSSMASMMEGHVEDTPTQLVAAWNVGLAQSIESAIAGLALAERGISVSEPIEA